MFSILIAPVFHPDAGVLQAGAPSRRDLSRLIAPYAKASALLGGLSFAVDFAVYLGGIAYVVTAHSLVAKAAGSFLIYLGMINFGSLAHEAAHRALVQSKTANKMIAVFCLTAICFNYRLWVYDHHVRHHGRTNIRHNNFLSPLALDEYRALSPFKQALQRAYSSRGSVGILLYFLLERWPSFHFAPTKLSLPGRYHASAWFYTGLMVAYWIVLASLIAGAATILHTGITSSLAFAAAPLLPWFYTFAMIAFMQHTNPRLRWYEDVQCVATHPERLSMHVRASNLLNTLTHHTLDHPVHHLSAAVPHYNLGKAQRALGAALGEGSIEMPFRWAEIRNALHACKLYDYERHVWMDYSGNVTAIPDDTAALMGR